jgi:hypothetical protein
MTWTDIDLLTLNWVYNNGSIQIADDETYCLDVTGKYNVTLFFEDCSWRSRWRERRWNQASSLQMRFGKHEPAVADKRRLHYSVERN